MTTSSLLPLGIVKPSRRSGRPRRRTRRAARCGRRRRRRVEADAGHRLGGRHARLLQEAHVERHAADVRRRDPVDERRRHLRLDGRARTAAARARRRRRPTAAADVRQRRTSRRAPASHPQLAERRAREAVVDVGQLRQQDVEGAGEGGDHQERPGPHAHEPLERLRLRRRDRGDLVAELVSSAFDARLRVAADSAERLQVRQWRRPARPASSDAGGGRDRRSAPTSAASDTSSSARSIACRRGVGRTRRRSRSR